MPEGPVPPYGHPDRGDLRCPQPGKTVHLCPHGDEGLMPCCGRTPFEVPSWHRMTKSCMAECGQILKDFARSDGDDGGVEIHVSTLPPLVAGPFTTAPLRCPHGVDYWVEPTSEQRAQWARDKTP